MQKKRNQLSDQELAKYFGEFVTGYRLLDDELQADMNQTKPADLWKKNPFAVFAYHLITNNKAQLFINGETYLVTGDFAQTICNQAQFPSPLKKDETFNQLISTQAILPA